MTNIKIRTIEYLITQGHKDWHIKRKKIGSSALSGKMLLARIVENNKYNTYFRAG